jgi:hypothetical protein
MTRGGWLDAFAFLDGPDPATERRRADGFLAVFLIVFGTEYLVRAIPKWPGLPLAYTVSVVLIMALSLAGLRRAWRRAAFVGLAAVHLHVLWLEFPGSANHAYLELFICLLGAFLDVEHPDERRHLLRAARWLACLVLFYSGFAKVVHGYWFHGEMLAHQLKFAYYRPVLGLVLPGSEFERLVAFTAQVGDGPYRVQSLPFVLGSNAVYLLEMGLALLLSIRRTRPQAALLALALIAVIEAGAREFFFGLVFGNMILLFTRRDTNTPAWWPVVGILALLVLIRLGLFGSIHFT